MSTARLLQLSFRRKLTWQGSSRLIRPCSIWMALTISPTLELTQSWLSRLLFVKQVLLRRGCHYTAILQTWLERKRSSCLFLLSMLLTEDLMLETSLLCRSSWFCPLEQRPSKKLYAWEQKCTITWKLSSKQNMVRMLPMLAMRVVSLQIFWITTRASSFWMLLLLRQATKVERTLKLEWMLLPLSSTRTRNMIWTSRLKKTRICLK